MAASKRYFGMTIIQIGTLSLLALVACITLSILGGMIFRPAPSVQEVSATYTLAPRPTAKPTTTPWPTITPVSDWKRHTFSNDQAQIWLPNSFFGGDTKTSSDEIMEKVRTTFNDETFTSDIEGLIAIPGILFFAIDTDSNDSARFMHVGSEPKDPDITLTMDGYLNHMMDKFSGGSERVVERQITQLDNFPVGKLVVESKVPAGDLDAFVSTAIYMIMVDDTMWFVTFRTGRDEFSSYQEIIQAVVNSFWIQL